MIRGVLILISLMVVGGCVASHQSVVTDVNVDEWCDPEYVLMNNSDTSTYRNIELFARYSPYMVDDSVTLIINTMSPDSVVYSEEVKLHFDTSTKGRKATEIGVFAYRNNVVWRQLGLYQIEISPLAPIKGVEAVGVNITKTTQKNSNE